MGLMILRKDPSWVFKDNKRQTSEPTPVSIDEDPPATNHRAYDRFREIAAQHGSHAVWLPQAGLLVTDDHTEAAKAFPYEEWRDLALR
jgi:hypothetical protein